MPPAAKEFENRNEQVTDLKRFFDRDDELCIETIINIGQSLWFVAAFSFRA